MQVKTLIKRLTNDDRAATAIEYGLILALLAVALIVGLNSFSTNVIAMYAEVEVAATGAL